MFTLMIGLSATGIAAGLGLGLARSRRRKQQLRQVLGLPFAAGNAVQSAHNLRALREFAALESRIRERSPHLSEAQRRELAVNLIRARGLLPLRQLTIH